MLEIEDDQDGREEALQQRFDVALASFPPSPPPDPVVLHERLRKRRIRTRVAGLAGLIVIISTVITVNVGGSNDATAAVTLYARDDTVSQGELSADAKIMRDRLDAVGDRSARIRISDGTLVITGGPADLADPGSVLTESPALLFRPLLCQSGPFDGSAAPSQALPLSCAGTPYVIQPAIPDPPSASGVAGYSIAPVRPDPALAAFPSTTPSADGTHPLASALLPDTRGNGNRDLVGPTQMTLSASVATASVAESKLGGWIVNVSLSPDEARLFDQVASDNFHLPLAVDLDGEIVSSPIIEPTQRSYRSFDGRIGLSGPSREWAEDVAAALQSGPLPIPLALARAA